jgi:hypothetical protein
MPTVYLLSDRIQRAQKKKEKERTKAKIEGIKSIIYRI